VKTFKLIFSILFVCSSLASARGDGIVSLDQLKPLAGADAKIETQKVFVYFWASWCPECREKFADGALSALQKDFPKTKIVTINADRTEERGKAFVEAEKISFPVYRDDSKALTKSLKIFGVPGWAVLNRNPNGQWSVQKSATGADLAEIRSELGRAM